MSNRYLIKDKNARRKKAGISPVVATVILVAVAVVIAAALAGFSGSLFGSYSNGPQIKVVSMTVHEAGGDPTVDVTMSNSGNAADGIQKISLNNVGIADSAAVQAADVITPAGFTGTTGSLPANTNPIEIENIAVTVGVDDTAPIVGQQVTAVIQMQSGSTITQTVTVVA